MDIRFLKLDRKKAILTPLLTGVILVASILKEHPRRSAENRR